MTMVYLMIGLLIAAMLVKHVTEKLLRALWRAVSGWRLRSTDTHLVIERRRRITPTLAELNDSLERHKAAEHADWTKVRRLEWEIYGQYKTGLDGRPLDEDDPAAHIKYGTAEQVARGDVAALMSAPVEPEGTPCWCNFCKGRVGVHGEDAVALYKAQARAAFAEHRAGRNVVISGDASGIIVAGGDVVINQSRIGDLTPQDIAGMSMAEYAKLRRAIDHLRYDLNRSTGRATRGFLE